MSRKRPFRVWVNQNEKNFINSLRDKQEFDGEQSHDELLEFSKERGFNVDKADIVWHKGNKLSVRVKENQFTYSDLRDDVIESMNNYSPKFPTLKRKELTDPHLLVIDIADLHINKYSDPSVSGYEYNSNIAIERAVEGTKGLLRKASGYNIEKILFVIGNDVLNTDTISRTTTSGTPQDTDMHWFKAFQLAREVYVSCIDTCLRVADVDIVHCPSNHDLMSGCFLADSLMSWYRKSKNATFLVSPKYRQYYRYYGNMIELEHGDKGKMQNIPLIMAQEQPKMWAETKFRYSYRHHYHHSDKTQFKTGKDYIGVNVTYLRSPSDADLWHAEQGYVSTVAVESFLHSRDKGRVAQFTHYF